MTDEDTELLFQRTCFFFSNNYLLYVIILKQLFTSPQIKLILIINCCMSMYMIKKIDETDPNITLLLNQP